MRILPLLFSKLQHGGALTLHLRLLVHCHTVVVKVLANVQAVHEPGLTRGFHSALLRGEAHGAFCNFLQSFAILQLFCIFWVSKDSCLCPIFKSFNSKLHQSYKRHGLASNTSVFGQAIGTRRCPLTALRRSFILSLYPFPCNSFFCLGLFSTYPLLLRLLINQQRHAQTV